MRVLHVSDAMGGGVVSSLLAMVEATPDIDHHLLARSRNGHDTGDGWADHFGSVSVLPDSPVLAVQTLRRLARKLYPDIVHAHSSFGGVLVRVAGLDRPRVAYSPHCFAFERRDINGTQRRFFEMVERALASRTDLLVAVAPHEIDLASELGYRNIAYAPNRSTLATSLRAEYAAPLRIAAAGRVCPQKDWRYFLHVKRYAQSQLGVEAEWVWLGGGDEDGEQELRDHGIAVTGWIPREELVEQLSEAQVYLHTAAWEAAPMSILEAAALGLPLAIRSISPLESLGLPGLAPSIRELGERISSMASRSQWVAAQQESDDLAARHTLAAQGRHLRDGYARVLDSGLRPVEDASRDLLRGAKVREIRSLPAAPTIAVSRQ